MFLIFSCLLLEECNLPVMSNLDIMRGNLAVIKKNYS